MKAPAAIVALVRLGRPVILPAGMLAYGLGLCMAYFAVGALDWRRALVGFIVTELANLAAHYADEYADVDTDAITRRTWFSGGSGVLPAGSVPPRWALRAAWACAGLTVVLSIAWIGRGLLSMSAAGILALGLVGGWVYSMPPVALERHGLGEIDNALIGGILMPLMAYTTQAGVSTPAALLACLPVLCSVFVGLLGVHWTDRTADAAVGKRSLAVVLGNATPVLHAGLLVATYVSAIALAGTILPAPVAWAILATAPIGVWALWGFARRDNPAPSSFFMVGVIIAACAGWIIAAG